MRRADLPLESLHHILVSDLLDVIRLCGLIAHTLRWATVQSCWYYFWCLITIYLFGTISLTIIWIKLFLWFTVAFQVWSLVTQVKLNGEPLCRYQRTSISPCVNHQIIGGFSSEIVAHQKLYCLVTLLVNLPNHNDRGNEKIKKAKCLISKAKTLNVEHTF